MSGDNILKTPGEHLGEARQKQRLSLEALAERTKIPVKVLAALEMDEYHKVSGPLYIKSFLRTCATDLGLDVDMILDLYTRFGGEAGGPVGAGEMVWNEEQVTVTRVGLPWVRILLFGGAGVVILGLILFAVRGCGSPDEPAAGTGSVDAVASRPVEDPRRGSLLAGDSTGVAAGPDAGADISGDAEPEGGEGEGGESEDADPSADPPGTGKEKPAAVTERDDETSGAKTGQPGQVETTPVRRTPERTATETPAFEDRDEPPVRHLGGLPSAIAGNAGTPFAEGRTWPVVLRLITDLPVAAEIRRDGERDFQTAAWTDPVALPMRDIRPGRAYGVREGLVVYWGAEDHFSLRLDRVVGVEVSINGVVRDIGSLRPGQEIILDDHSAAGSGR